MESDDDLPQNAAASAVTSTYYPDFSRKLVCVQYPGMVKNVDRAVETLGGMSTLEGVVGNPYKKLELRFQPKNIYCKPCIADRDYKPGVLLKVKIRRPKVNPKEEAGPSRAPSAVETTVTGYEVVGVTAMGFQFNRLCDFQYLPLIPAEGEHEEKETPLKYIYDKILPDQLPDKSWLISEESKTMSCFLPPNIFSRYNSSDNKLEFDKTDVYNSTMRPEIGEQLLQFERKSEARRAKTSENENVSQRASMIHNNRRSRKAFSTTVNYNDTEMPSEPGERVLSLLRLDIVKDISLDKIRELFEERPIWSKIAIAYRSGIPFRLLKYVLPSVAYYFISGPWRVMWVRYGYDPRKDPSARIYQTFDFRVRDVDTSILCSKDGIKAIRTPNAVQKFSLKDSIQKRNANLPEIKEHYFVLRPGVIPYGRQAFYQFCDVQLPEVQNMIARLPEIPAGQTCDPKTGWLPDHFHDQCREIANKYVQQQAKKVFIEERERIRSIKTIDETDSAHKREAVQTSDDEDRIVIDDDSDTEIREEQDDEDEAGVIVEQTEEWNTDEDDDEVPVIDLDAVEEVNKLLQSSRNPKQEDPDIDTKTIEVFAEMLKD